MKKLITTLCILAILASCKKTEVAPICYLIQWEKTTVYGPAAGDKHYETHGLPQIERGHELRCDLTAQSLEALLKTMNGTEHTTAGICITVHAVATKSNTKN